MGRALTASFLADFKTNLQAKSEQSYQNKLKNLHYAKFTRTMTSESEREILAWLLSTARLQRNGQGGNIEFDSLAQVKQTYVNGNFDAGLKLKKNQLTDLDGKGVELATEWNAQIGADIAYFPQREVVTQLLNGETGLCFDGKAYFAKDHPIHPALVGIGTYANLFSGAAASTPSTDPNDAGYPGACPIDESVTVDVAMSNLNKVLAYISSIKMPNGVDPRFLTVKGIIHPPKLRARVKQLTNAKLVAQPTSGGGGSANVEAVVQDWGFGEPICMAEIGGGGKYPLGENGDGSTVSGDDTSYYLLCAEEQTSDIGALVWIEREPVTIQAFMPDTQVKLAEAREFEWLAQGRGVAGYGIPYFLFKVKAT